jgi:DNA polymerase
VPPERAGWRVAGAGVGQAGLFEGEGEGGGAVDSLPAGKGRELRVPLRFLLLARRAALHADPGRFGSLYRLLWRIAVLGERWLVERPTDPDVARVEAMARAVDRAAHRMRAFVRFREVWTARGPRHVAWFEPEHHVLGLCAPFFADRFPGMRWVVVTPGGSAAWDGAAIAYGPGGSRADVPDGDARDEDWRAYYAAVFNPARLNTRAMRRDMPERYWRDMPETRAIPGLVAAASARAGAMLAAPPAGPPPASRKGRVVLLPHPRHRGAGDGREGGGAEAPATLAAARAAADACRRCPLWEHATGTVFGEGPADARVMLVGEQPGDREDLEGRPFVGPAGQVLDRALAEAGLERSDLYLTNAVKHFKFAPRGKRRIHKRPDVGEIQACGPWLALERGWSAAAGGGAGCHAGPRAARPRGRVGRERGAAARSRRDRHPPHRPPLLHPPLPSAELQAREYARLVADLRLAAPYLASSEDAAASPAASASAAA